VNGDREQNASVKNKAGSNTVTAHSDRKRNISEGLSFAITLLYSTYLIKTFAEQTDCEYQGQGT
jgi:hypothetical protein